MRMKRKDTQLLVENWRQFINEGIDLTAKGEKKRKGIKLRSEFASKVNRYNSSLNDKNPITDEKIKISFTIKKKGDYPPYIDNDLSNNQFTLNQDGQMSERGLFIKSEDKIYFSQFSVLDMFYLTSESKRDDTIAKYMRKINKEPEINKVIELSKMFENWKDSDKCKFMNFLEKEGFTEVKNN